MLKKSLHFLTPSVAIASMLAVAACDQKSADTTADAASTPSASNSYGSMAKINDPDGFYNFFSDPGVTSHPPSDFVVGKGQVVEIKYDGSQGGDILSYQLYYLDKNGSVHPIGGGNLDSKGNGLYSRDIIIYNSSADKHPGFLEITTVVGAGMQDGKINYGKNVKLGMYPVRLEASQ